MRRKIVAGNWKMNKTPSEAVELIKELLPLVKTQDVDVVFCVPFVDIKDAVELAKGSNVKIGAQNMYFEDKGAYTGEISPAMLKDCGVEYVIIGHSERRQYFCETDETVNKKLKKAFEYGFIPIVCCGETLEQREAGITLEWIKGQIKGAFSEIEKDDAKKVIIAYEPIWAIGTGRVATNEQAEEVCHAIRNVIEDLYGKEIAEEIRIQYGGSVNAKNAADLFAQPDIDGGLVGGASLKAEFADIVNYK